MSFDVAYCLLLTSAMESIISMSAALVGSSKSSRWGFCREISQKTRRVFRPSESSLMGCASNGDVNWVMRGGGGDKKVCIDLWTGKMMVMIT